MIILSIVFPSEQPECISIQIHCVIENLVQLVLYKILLIYKMMKNQNVNCTVSVERSKHRIIFQTLV